MPHALPVSSRPLLALQLLLTLGVIASGWPNALRLALLLVLWALTFRPAPTTRELVLFVVACVFFTAMNAASLAQGIFRFTRPDLLGMPWWELAMWGFYLLHTLRMVGGPAPAPDRRVWVLAALYAAAFGTLSDARLLLAATALLLAVMLWLHHDRHDLAYTGYMVLLGALVEYTGVLSGEWSYPSPPPGGVPPWFVTLWGGVGWFLRRLVLPVLAPARRP